MAENTYRNEYYCYKELTDLSDVYLGENGEYSYSMWPPQPRYAASFPLPNAIRKSRHRCTAARFHSRGVNDLRPTNRDYDVPDHFIDVLVVLLVALLSLLCIN